MSAQDDAIKLIDEFEKRDHNDGWIHLKVEDAAFALRQRVTQPNVIDSTEVNLCGPAAFLRTIAKDDPVAFARFAIGLYEQGQGTIGTLKVSTGSYLKTVKTPSGLDQVDWMLMASLRNSENAILRFESVDDGASGITMPSGLAGWFTKAGYSNVQNDTNVLLTKDFAHLEAASNLRAHGYTVCLFVNAKILKATSNKNLSLTPDHWVVLDGSVAQGLTAGSVAFKVWCWGKVRSVPQTGTLTTSEATRSYYGYVAVKK